MTILTGGCQCGALRFKATAAIEGSYVCHCRMCQKSVGGPFAAFATVAAASFAWTRGQPAEWASSSLGVRQFCAACGTPVGYRYVDAEDARTQYLNMGAFDDWRSVAPAVQVGVESKVAWVDHLSALPLKDTGQAVGAEKLSRIVSYQHPDEDTAAWTPRPPETLVSALQARRSAARTEK
jgi:hypothetical protein